MRLRIVIALILTTLIIGGCRLSNGDGTNQSSGNHNQNEAKAKPNVEAFNNQFTEEFLTSTESVREGYYPLEGKSGAFTMDKFPPLEQADLDEELAEMKYSVDTGFSYIENYRKAIEELFKEDEEVSTLFDLSRRI